ncbi:VanZ family protein [Bradyrhizobium jicamae]|uniref:VanZ family protein n=2 Tax=Bradyrhizobium jicamae TaxID=280332 RepID=A0ABS5FK67_9BRAD|nr:VanZ family protein [Bradyrhizobium jicamae]MBR0934906.1 VanZ family protein [Bradyrhizobium jicamae]
MSRRLFTIAALGCLAFIAYATLSSLAERPVLSLHETAAVVFVERFGAFALLGCLVCLSEGGRITRPCAIVLGVAILLEMLQVFRVDRDPGLFDVVEKAAGGITGILIARGILAFAPRHV